MAEGVALAAYAVGAERAFIAVRADATVAIRRLATAIREAEEAGLIGHDSVGRGIRLQIELRELQGAFVVGEETVLLRAIEGKRAMPDQRPPYPAVKGLWGEPTVVNNVATLASVPWIVTNGPGAFRTVDVGRENERRPDVVPGTYELFESPPQDLFCLRLVDQLELCRSHLKDSLSSRLTGTQLSVIGSPYPSPEVQGGRTDGPESCDARPSPEGGPTAIGW